MGGSSFKDILPSSNDLQLYKIRINEGNGFDGLEVIYKNVFSNKMVSLGKHGSLSNKAKEIILNDQDCIQKLTIVISRFKKRVYQLIIYKDNQRLVFGKQPSKYLGEQKTTYYEQKGCLGGFQGRSGDYIDRLGPVFQIGSIYQTEEVGGKGGKPFEDKIHPYTTRPFLIAIYRDNHYLNGL